MNGLQSFYWRRWAAVVAANGWRMFKGRLVCDATENQERSPLHAQVWHLADQAALQEARKVDAEALRHACHVVAAGQDFSASKLTPQLMDCLVPWWGNGRDQEGLLINPDCVASAKELADPKAGVRRRMDWRLKHSSPDAYRHAIRRDQDMDPGATDETFLDHDEVRRLTITMAQRTRRFTAPKEPF